MLNFLTQSLWLIATIMIFLSGIYFSFKLKFVHLNFSQMIKEISKKKNNEDGISLFESLTMSLAGRIGVGSLSGIALAIYLGGPRCYILDMAYFIVMFNKCICRKCFSYSF